LTVRAIATIRPLARIWSVAPVRPLASIRAVTPIRSIATVRLPISHAGRQGAARRGDHAPMQQGVRRLHPVTRRRDEARHPGLQVQRADQRTDPASVDVAEARLVHAAPAEIVFAHRDDRVANVHVPVHVNVLDVDDGRPVDDDVVHDARSAPPAPPRAAGESGTSPPWDDGLAPAERDPADGWHRDTDTHAG
jgi:hypothetical protein